MAKHEIQITIEIDVRSSHGSGGAPMKDAGCQLILVETTCAVVEEHFNAVALHRNEILPTVRV